VRRRRGGNPPSGVPARPRKPQGSGGAQADKPTRPDEGR
jgi:hypothetical protein